MSIPVNAINKIGVIERVIDFAKEPSTDGQAVEVIALPKGYAVLVAGAEVIEKEGAAASGTLGTASEANAFVASLDANTPGIIASTHEFRLYKDGGSIKHTTTKGLKKAKLRYFCVALNLSGQ